MTGWLQAFAGDGYVEERLGEAAQLRDMLVVEAAYARAAGAVGMVSAEMGADASDAILSVTLDLKALAEEAVQDGLPVPALVAQIKAQVPEALHDAVHSGLTSQDVMDTALVLSLKDCLVTFEQRIAHVRSQLDDVLQAVGHAPLMARTRMQTALPMRVAQRIEIWASPWDDLLQWLEQLRPRVLRLQLGGPIGDRSSFQGYGDAIADHMAAELGLGPCDRAWHTDRTRLVELASWMVAVTGHLGKIGADLTLMTQQGVEEAQLRSGGSSSSMAHKSNPVKAELLVSLARDTAAQLGVFSSVLVHEQERSGAAWTLEWLVLPRLVKGCGAALQTAQSLLGDIEHLGGPGS